MTVIVTDGKTMACDGVVIQQDTVIDLRAVKIKRLKDGSLFGTCGDVVVGDEMTDWLDDPERKNYGFPGHQDEATRGLHLRMDGTVALYETGCFGRPVVVQPPMAIGAGMDFALAAMDCGVTTLRAVATAIERSPWCAGMVTVMSLEPQQPVPGTYR